MSLKTRTMHRAGGLLLAAAALAVSGEAAAQERADADRVADGGVDADRARFRGGIVGEAGALIITDPAKALTAFGAQGHIGVQFSDLVGLYLAPSLDIIVGDLGGVSVGSAVLVDFTFDDTWQFGIGPDAEAFAAIGVDSNSAQGAGGELYGGRLHFAVFPAVGDGEDGIRRKGLALGVDVRMLVGEVLGATVTSTGVTASSSSFIVAPTAFIGYEAF